MPPSHSTCHGRAAAHLAAPVNARPPTVRENVINRSCKLRVKKQELAIVKTPNLDGGCQALVQAATHQRLLPCSAGLLTGCTERKESCRAVPNQEFSQGG